MHSNPSPPLTHDEIHAFVDGELSPPERASVQSRLTQDAQAQASVQQWQQQRDLLQTLHSQVLAQEIPVSLVSAAQRVDTSQQDLDQWWRWGGRAASVLLVFGMGWISNSAWRGEQPVWPDSAAQARAGVARNFVRQAGFAHAVFSSEKRHPVEVNASEQEHLVQWLSKRVGKTLKVPDLAPQGYELVGGRLLPGEAGARAQFMFQDAAGTRITLYLGAVDKSPAGTDPRETGFHFSTDGPIPSFYWIDQGFGYALAGPIPRDKLMQLAQAVYRQL